MWNQPPPHQTITRPLPPLPPHLQSQYGSRPTSPDPNQSSSASSTPNQSGSPRHLASGLPKRGRPRPSSSAGLDNGGVDVPVGGYTEEQSTTGQSSHASGSKDTEVKKEKSTKRVRVGARASIACATCRRRKVRCSGEWPVCAFCSARSLSCVYEGHPAENGGPLPSVNGTFGLASFLPMTTLEPILPPLPIILEALDIFFIQNYDTFYFLHRATLTESIKNDTCAKELVCCILAFAGRSSQSLRDLHPVSPTAASEHYAALAAQVLQNPPPLASGSPAGPQSDRDISLTRCQCSLILGLWEITEGVENKGWLRIGSAIRMAQVLRLGFVDEDEASASATLRPQSRMDPLQAEIRRRTFWSCFLLDRTITDGKERPSSLTAPPSLRMPCSDADFNLGRRSLGAKFEADPPPWSVSTKIDTTVIIEPEADLYGQTLRIAEVWNKVTRYIGAGGRNVDRRPPWEPESTFAVLDREMDMWNARLPAVFRFDDANLVAHSMIGQGRLFGMLHLLFCCSKLVLHRDYLPFLPTIDFQPSNGPIDGEPLYGQPYPPPHWWQGSVDQAVEASATISDLSTALGQHGSQITHPFSGFSALAAGTMHAHLKYWPQSSTKHNRGAEYYDQDLAVLNALRDTYPIASIWYESMSKLNRLYSNLVRGVLDADPSKVRANVIKLLRTTRDEENSSTGSAPTALPSLTETANGTGSSTMATELDLPFTSQFSDLNELGLDDDYSLDLNALGNVDWTSWDLGWINMGGSMGSSTDNALWGL